MKTGLFMMPSHPPERSLGEGFQWDLNCLALADELGVDEAWIGEHFTAPWEPNPTPDLLIAQALLRTKRIKLAPGGHLLPFHHPVELACRVAYLDHIAQGRFMFGVAAGSLPTDFEAFNIDGVAGQHREMMREALDIILKLWESEEPFQYRGKFWSVNRPDTTLGTLKWHFTPYQKPHPPIGIAGVSPGSDTLKIAGERGFMPMSLNVNPSYLASHWASVVEGAQRTGRTPSRKDWRVVHEVYVAETDKEARDAVTNGMLGRVFLEYLLPFFAFYKLLPLFKHDQSLPDSAVTPEYLVDHGWLVGSPETVTEKLKQMYEDVGGFGTLLVLVVDGSENQQGWETSMRLLMNEVMPHFADLEPA